MTMLPVCVTEGVTSPVAALIVAPRLFPTMLHVTGGLPAGTTTAAEFATFPQTDASTVLAGNAPPTGRMTAPTAGFGVNVGCCTSTSVMLWVATSKGFA